MRTFNATTFVTQFNPTSGSITGSNQNIAPFTQVNAQLIVSGNVHGTVYQDWTSVTQADLTATYGNLWVTVATMSVSQSVGYNSLAIASSSVVWGGAQRFRFQANPSSTGSVVVFSTTKG